MPNPTTLPPLPTNNSGASFTVLSTDDALQQRTLDILLALKERFPSRFTYANLWHPLQVTVKGSPVSTIWFRMAENVEFAFTEKFDRWFQDKVGLLLHKTAQATIPVGFDVRSEDRIILAGKREAYLVIDSVEQSGVQHLIITKDGSAFATPPSTSRTLRLMTVGAVVG